MKVRERLRLFAILTLILCNIGCDQISKGIVRERVGYHENFKILTDQFTLMKVENTGAFLSVGSSLPYLVKLMLLSLLPVLVICYAVFLLISKRNIPTLIVLGLASVIGGGIGNLYDRIRYGSVTDFLHIDFGVFQTGVFNMADVSIMLGMLLIVIGLSQKRAQPLMQAN
ncbi:MAG: signal peptidase II [Chryseobacterium sp.]|nr:MAG: signal peptidase II [Chryseobacterium sp.]